MKVKFSSVKEFCISKNITIYQPDKLRKNVEIFDLIKSLNPDIIVVAAYGKILPKEILDIPKYGCVNVHGSLLPKYRGAAPIQHAIINGDDVTGITTMYMDVGMDTGDMLLKRELKILEEDNFNTVYKKLSKIGGELLIETLDKIITNDIVRIKQDDNYTIAPMIDKDFCKIDFNKNAKQVFNFVRGLMNAYMIHSDGRKFKVTDTKVFKNDENYEEYSIGQVVYNKQKLIIKCGDNTYIEILKIQPENSKQMEIIPFLNGNKINIGDKFI